MNRIAAALFLVVAVSGSSLAQQQSAATPPYELTVRTIPLHHLTSAEAVKLLSPYSLTPGGGVYEISPQIRAVTVRETPKIFAEMMAVLSQYDREPASVTLNFQLIAAENSNSRDPGVAILDSLLRNVLKYSGYRLLTTSVATASENGYVSQTLSADGETFTLGVSVSDLRIEGTAASVHLTVALSRNAAPAKGQMPASVFTTGVTVPVGQTVVLGTSSTDSGQRALFLTVRPQLASTKK